MITHTREIEISRVTPSTAAILEAQGIPTGRSADPRTRRLAEQAVRLFSELAVPAGIAADTTKSDFTAIYDGDGGNDAATPLDNIIPEASRLLIFAVTVGQPVCDEISALFARNDFAAGAMLDAAASCGADLAADAIERQCEDELRSASGRESSSGAMRFSPGYCGWHVTGQRRLFAALKPERIGISLNDSCLMRPLKSVSGVVVVAPRQVFDIDDTYPFCAACSTHSCRDRFATLIQKHDS